MIYEHTSMPNKSDGDRVAQEGRECEVWIEVNESFEVMKDSVGDLVS